MEFFFLLLGIFLVARWLITASINAFIPKDEKLPELPKSYIVINNYFSETHNHLHVDENKLKQFKDEQH